MSHNNKPGPTGPSDYAGFLQSMIQLDVLDKITDNLTAELADSQRVMMDIKAIFESIPDSIKTPLVPDNNHKESETVSKLLDLSPKNVLLPDMNQKHDETDLANVIATMRRYAEDLKKNYIEVNKLETKPTKDINDLDLQQYATSLDKLCKQLENLKLNKKDDTNNKNSEFEAKLNQLCQNVNMFTQVVQTNSMVSEERTCKNWPDVENALTYDNIINNLICTLNDVSYLLHSTN
ncbi:hypothetical protein ACJJTC_000363 [Scirpophaga incertulas]